MARKASTAPRKRPASREATVATDAAFASPADALPRIRNVSEVRHFFRTNDVPVFFVGATPFNLLGLDRWVRNLTYIAYYDGWDGAHPAVYCPSSKASVEFDSGEAINNWLLRSPEVRAFMSSRVPKGVRPKVAMVFFDTETEQICEDLGYDLILPAAALREYLDSKLVTTRLAAEVGVCSVPNIITTAEDWASLEEHALAAGLGTDLVIQTAYGDSGKTTYFVDGPKAWAKYAIDLVGADVKVMKRINNRPIAVEAVLTSSGTLVGPFMSELAGQSELTPYRGGWCGNEMYPDVLSLDQRKKAGELVRSLGDRLKQEGYRGFFEVDFLVDTDTGDLYLGELNPRISGATSITHVTAGAYADVPLFLFHLLEYMEVPFQLDVDEINARWQELASVDLWSQMVVKETGSRVERIEQAAPTGQYQLDAAGNLVFMGPALDWHQLSNESQAFFLRIYGPGDYRWEGADLGVIVTKGRVQTVGRANESRLSIRAKHLIDSIRDLYVGMPLVPPRAVPDVSLTSG